MDKIEETYLDIISESYHHKPFMGWTYEKFIEILKGEISHSLNKFAYRQIDNQFVKASIYSFKKLLNEEPEIKAAGSGINTKIEFIYKTNSDIKLFLGDIDKLKKIKESDEKDFGDESKEKKTKKQQKLQEDSLGILYNPTFYKWISGLNEGFDDLEEEGDDNSIISKVEESLAKNDEFGLIFSFQKPEYVDGMKKRDSDLLNPNYIKSIPGTLEFFVKDQEKKFKVGTLNWQQKRTSNMDPPKPLSQEVKERWNNPANTYGVAGLLAKKALGGLLHMFNVGTGGTLQQEDLKIDIDNPFTFTEIKSKIGEETSEEADSKNVSMVEAKSKNKKLLKAFSKLDQSLNNGYKLVQAGVNERGVVFEVKNEKIVLFTINFILEG